MLLGSPVEHNGMLICSKFTLVSDPRAADFGHLDLNDAAFFSLHLLVPRLGLPHSRLS